MNINKLLLIIFCISLPIFLLLFSYKTISLTTNYTPQQQEWMDYFKDKDTIPSNYTNNEVSHMQDVKTVMYKVDIVFYIFLLILTLIITFYKKNKKQIKKLFKLGGITTIVSLSLISLIGILSYRSLFTLFHAIFFPQGNWTFPINSLLLTTFSYQFFISITVKIFILTIFFGILFILLASFLKNDHQS